MKPDSCLLIFFGTSGSEPTEGSWTFRGALEVLQNVTNRNFFEDSALILFIFSFWKSAAEETNWASKLGHALHLQPNTPEI